MGRRAKEAGGRTGPRVLRALAALMIRGRDADYIRDDLNEAYDRDLERGLSRARACLRYAANAGGSAWSLWTRRLRAPLSVSSLDVVLGIRLLRKQPGLTVVSVLALAIGIPVGLAPTHAAKALETAPWFDRGERIQVLKYYDTGTSGWRRVSRHDFTVWRDELESFEALAVTTRGEVHNLGVEEGRSAPVPGARVTSSAFAVLRVPAMLGRTLREQDEAPGAPRVVVISRDLWQARLAGDPGVIGLTVRIDGVPHEIVGVMPGDFHFPIGEQLWLPMRVDATADDHGDLVPTVFGRLADGVSAADAQAELDAVSGRLAATQPEPHARLKAEVVPFTIGLFGLPKGGLDSTLPFYFFQTLALLILTVACVNIGMLFLTRTTARSSELAIRTALGASRSRVVMQLFTESLVLSVVAAGAGLVAADIVANRAFDWLVRSVPNWIDLGVSTRTVLLALILSAFSAGIVGVIPALKATNKSVQRNLQRSAAQRSGVRFGGFSSVLIIIDVALAVVTLGIGLVTSEQLMKTRNGMGVDAGRYVAAAVALSPASVDERTDEADAMTRDAAAQEELIRRILEEPDVRNVAIADMLPGMDHPSRDIEVESGTATGAAHRVRVARVDIGYFDALEQPITLGRPFGPLDLLPGSRVIIVNTSFVDRVLGGRNPLGQRIRSITRSGTPEETWYEIVGVVGHLGLFELNPDLDEGFYYPLPPGTLAAEARAANESPLRRPVRLAIRTDSDAQAIATRLREIAVGVDPAAVVSSVQRLDRVFSFDRYTMGWIRLGVFALVAVLLAMSTSGTYALLSFTVSQRTREIGIRTALGESRTSLVLAIAKRALIQLAIGVLGGLVVLSVLISDLNSQLQRPATELVVLVATVGLGILLLVGLLACGMPMRRALRIMPIEALRSR